MLKYLEMNWLPLRDFLVLGNLLWLLTPFCRRTKTLYRNIFCLCSSVLGGLERPDVDKIEGLSPVIAIEQKTTNKIHVLQWEPLQNCMIFCVCFSPEFQMLILWKLVKNGELHRRTNSGNHQRKL